MKKFVVWIPGFSEPKIVRATKWEWRTYEGRGNRIVFIGENGGLTGVVTADCAVFEAETPKRPIRKPVI